MAKVMREYQNQHNNGRERVYQIDGKYFIDSDWGNGFDGNLVPVSRRDMLNCLQFTKAPSSIIIDILGDISDINQDAEPEVEEEFTFEPFDGGRGAGSMGQPID